MGVACGKPGSSPKKSKGGAYSDANNALKTKAKSTDPFRLAWTLSPSNQIKVQDPAAKEAMIFDGTQLALESDSDVGLIKYIPELHYLISTNSNSSSAGFTMFNVEEMKDIYSFERKKGIIVDVAYNANREILAALSINQKTLYHLFDLADGSFVKRGAWPESHAADISSFDFDPLGQKIVSMDKDGTCCVSDINSNATLFSINTLRVSETITNRCRWNPNPDTSVIAVRFEKTRLHIIDTVQQVVRFRAAKVLDSLDKTRPYTYAIEWDPEGKMLACAGSDKIIRIFSLKELSIVKEVKTQHTGAIRALQWSPDGTMVATCSEDNTVQMYEVGTGKMYFLSEKLAPPKKNKKGETEIPGKGHCSSVCFI